jgi:hypothetical protein
MMSQNEKRMTALAEDAPLVDWPRVEGSENTLVQLMQQSYQLSVLLLQAGFWFVRGLLLELSIDAPNQPVSRRALS